MPVPSVSPPIQQIAENTSRPLFALCVYDVRPGADSYDGLRALTLAIHQDTEEERRMYEMIPSTENRDRIEVVGLPMALDSVEEQRIKVCRSHHMVEVAPRRASHGVLRNWQGRKTRR